MYLFRLTTFYLIRTRAKKKQERERARDEEEFHWLMSLADNGCDEENGGGSFLSQSS